MPHLVASMRMMPKSVRPEAIPTMAGLVVAAGTGPEPQPPVAAPVRRLDQGRDELPGSHRLPARGAHPNRITDDRDFATRLISKALNSADQD